MSEFKPGDKVRVRPEVFWDEDDRDGVVVPISDQDIYWDVMVKFPGFPIGLGFRNGEIEKVED